MEIKDESNDIFKIASASCDAWNQHIDSITKNSHLSLSYDESNTFNNIEDFATALSV